MVRGRSRPLELHAEVHQVPVSRSLELVLDRGHCARNKSLTVHTLHSHAVNFRAHLSRVRKPIRNHLDASQVARVTAARLGLSRWAKRKRWTFRKGCGL